MTIPWCACTAACLALALAGGCASDPSLDDPEISRSATVMLGDLGAAVPSSGAFGWLGGYVQAADGGPADPLQVEQAVRAAMTDTLRRRGYRMVAPESSDRLISFVVALDGAVDDRTLSARYGIQPGLARSLSAAQQYEKGTLIIDIVRTGSRHATWRGAVQANVVPGLDDDTRRERIGRAVERLLAGLPERR